MSVVIAYAADSLLTSAVNGRLVDATSYLDSEANNYNINTANADSQPFTPGAITIDAFAVKVCGLGNLSVEEILTDKAEEAGFDHATEVDIFEDGKWVGLLYWTSDGWQRAS